mmetsp:Transcript_97928/g.285732  ORF Transcript_97928/g.285732 Transcript_97928/m.285732 type:complete len:700 (+) Transcript_97928:953-3052(+)
MQGTLEKEMKEDEELYDKLACWCNKNEYDKDEAISSSESKVAELGSTIESLTAKGDGLKTSIKELEDELAADKTALAEASALREKQQKEFHGHETDSIQAIENLKAAIEVLSKHHNTAPESTVGGGAVFKSEKDSWESLLSVDIKEEPWSTEHELARMTRSLDDFMRRNGFDAAAEGDASPAPERRAPPKFLQHGVAAEAWAPEDAALVRRALKSAAAFMQAHHRDGYYPAYQSQSGEIFGLLKQLKEEMEGDLAESQKRESLRAATFAELRSAKASEIQNGETMAEKKEDGLATTMNNLAEAKEDLGQEQASLSADQKFMTNLKSTCAESSTNFEKRKTARLQEIQAVSEAIHILTEDTARDAMSGTYSLLQGSSRERHESEHRRKAAQVLRQKARSLRSPQLSILATTVELDAFTRVKKAIDDMVAQLLKEKEDEIKHKDFCVDEFNKNQLQTEKKEREKRDLIAKIEDLELTIQTLADEIESLKSQIAEMQVQMKRAGEDREKQNKEFQMTVADQRETQKMLTAALTFLEDFYGKQSTTFLQRQEPVGPPPPPGFEAYKKNSASGGVLGLIKQIIGDAKAMEAEAIRSEEDAQKAYEDFVKETNASIEAKSREIVNKSEEKATAEADLVQAKESKEAVMLELEQLSNYNAELHQSCDFVMKNFEVRQTARDEEIEALKQAKAILSGANFNAFLQRM